MAKRETKKQSTPLVRKEIGSHAGKTLRKSQLDKIFETARQKAKSIAKQETAGETVSGESLNVRLKARKLQC